MAVIKIPSLELLEKMTVHSAQPVGVVSFQASKYLDAINANAVAQGYTTDVPPTSIRYSNVIGSTTPPSETPSFATKQEVKDRTPPR